MGKVWADNCGYQKCCTWYCHYITCDKGTNGKSKLSRQLRYFYEKAHDFQQLKFEVIH